MAVCSAVRSVEFTEPSALTSLKSRVYRAEVSLGGGPILPNWAPLRTSNGVTNPNRWGAELRANAWGRRPPDTGRRRLREVNVGVASVMRPLRDQGVGSQFAECFAASLGLAVGNLSPVEAAYLASRSAFAAGE